MITLLAAHICAAIVAPWLVGRLHRIAFMLLALVPGSAFVWALVHTSQVLSGNADTIPAEHVMWVPGLDLDIWFRMDMLSWLMTMIVGGVGALVLLYSSRYFGHSAVGSRRFAAVFVGFAGAMLGVVTVDHTMGLYTFWEATSLLSFLLIGHHFDRRPARAAARQALLITTSGSLAMFAGFVMWGLAPGGSFRLSELAANLADGTMDAGSPLVATAAVLVLLGAFTKSALFPAHFWLPGAMAAPTPVSAYLHAAAMVKAGVYLVARLTPGATHIALWSPLIVTIGLITMVLGGWRALRQTDLKLVLAFGTVSQLGLITATVGFGSHGAMVAGLIMLIAHSCFKSTLFLTVGAVESSTGTRDLRRLTGLARRLPVLAVAAALACLSMAGVPITVGYVGKESMISTLLGGSGAPWTGAQAAYSGPTLFDLIVLAVIAIGSMLTVAYSWRAWWGAFGTRTLTPTEQKKNTEGSAAVTQKSAPEVDANGQLVRVKPVPLLMLIPICLLSLGALIGLAPTGLEDVLRLHGAYDLDGSAHVAWWSGWEPALITLAIFAGGALLAAFGYSSGLISPKPRSPLSAIYIYSWSVRELEIIATRVTRLIQRGSLPWDLSTIVVTMLIGVGSAVLIFRPSTYVIRPWDSILQVGIGIVIIICALLTARSRRRMRAVFALGGVGLGVAVLYASQGAPDLALTQIVVESVSMVIFVLVLRRLPRFFSDRPLARSRWWRFIVALLMGIGTVFVGLYASSARIHSAVSELMPNEASEFGYGENIVNVILVDIRAWDTVGELSVLLVTATGVASLIYVSSRVGRVERAPRDLTRESTSFLPAATALRSQDRSTVLEVVTRLLFPTMIVVSLWLLLIGHNNPGGGFSGGVVAGLAFVLRYLAGGRYELAEAIPIPAGRVLGTGLFVAAGGALMPLLYGNSVLQSTPLTIDVGVLGDIHFTTAMILDVGVYILVVGLVLDLVASAGAEIDQQAPTPISQQKTGRKH
ncbi:Na+/H+ antiporter subunit A [Pauljensenia sp. UMB10120]|uniref:Na+/H+ antiporter subunit A n=1 Tax=Pauljensenia sp. UMB10120 TaxID=3046356 RepID=UPI0025513A0C|nr:Na+/H+ antiporter subunit A [Pauljensenia sp. UMB10120]MDK6242822.1 Na+/H+ antiporter subunit A [Pauljensenia sp. UMB10120]